MSMQSTDKVENVCLERSVQGKLSKSEMYALSPELLRGCLPDWRFSCEWNPVDPVPSAFHHQPVALGYGPNTFSLSENLVFCDYPIVSGPVVRPVLVPELRNGLSMPDRHHPQPVRKHGAFTMVPSIRNGVSAASIAALDQLSESLTKPTETAANAETGNSPVDSTLKPDVSSTTSWAQGHPAWNQKAQSRARRGISRRAVFSDVQRQRLEDRFQVQKYISKPDRKKLAESLGLKDSQVKVWFQNRRMKWRNYQEREMLSARNRVRPGELYEPPDLPDIISGCG